jgi:hypothetical protein
VTNVELAAGVLTFGAAHQSLDNRLGNAPYTVGVTMTDKDGGSTSATTAVTVNKQPEAPGQDY